MQLKKIEAELISYAKKSTEVYVIESDKYYKTLCKYITESLLSPRLIHRHIIQILKVTALIKLNETNKVFTEDYIMPD
jgi:hypothetical protein